MRAKAAAAAAVAANAFGNKFLFHGGMSLAFRCCCVVPLPITFPPDDKGLARRGLNRAVRHRRSSASLAGQAAEIAVGWAAR
jgi:hypothetical protein